eukprot:Selendium_serpulae@DN4410_c0_g1_i2.p1
MGEWKGRYQKSPFMTAGSPSCTDLIALTPESATNPNGGLTANPLPGCMFKGYAVVGNHLTTKHYLHTQVTHTFTCQHICQLTAPCVAWQHIPSNGDCLLFESVAVSGASLISSKESVSGSRDCMEGRLVDVLSLTPEPGPEPVAPAPVKDFVSVLGYWELTPMQMASYSFCPSMEANVDYLGYDMVGEEPGCQVRSSAECLYMCRGTKGCSFWTHDQDQMKCYMKTSDQGRRRAHARGVVTSGPTWCVHVNPVNVEDESRKCGAKCLGETPAHVFYLEHDYPPLLTGSRIVEASNATCLDECTYTGSCVYYKWEQKTIPTFPHSSSDCSFEMYIKHEGLCYLYDKVGPEINTDDVFATGVAKGTGAPTAKPTGAPTVAPTGSPTTAKPDSTKAVTTDTTTTDTTKSTTRADSSTAAPHPTEPTPPAAQVTSFCALIRSIDWSLDTAELHEQLREVIAGDMGEPTDIVRIVQVTQGKSNTVARQLQEEHILGKDGIVDWIASRYTETHPTFDSYLHAWENNSIKDPDSLLNKEFDVDPDFVVSREISTRDFDRGIDDLKQLSSTTSTTTTKAPPKPATMEAESDEGLPPGVIVGIVLTALAVVLLVLCLVMYLAARRRKKKEREMADTGGRTPGQVESNLPISPKH